MKMDSIKGIKIAERLYQKGAPLILFGSQSNVGVSQKSDALTFILEPWM